MEKPLAARWGPLPSGERRRRRGMGSPAVTGGAGASEEREMGKEERGAGGERCRERGRS